MERVYLDSVAMIYFVERRMPWFTSIHARLTATPVQIVVSDPTRMECRVKPIQLGAAALLADFDAAFAAVEVVPLPPAVFERATTIRASFGFKTPDALHLAAAIEHGCATFLTNDRRLSAFTGIAVEVV